MKFSNLKLISQKTFTFLIFFFGLLILLGSPVISFAANPEPGISQGLEGFQPSGIKCIFYAAPPAGQTPSKYFKDCTKETSLVTVAIRFLQDIAPFVTTILLIIGGFEFFNDTDIKKTTALSTVYAAIAGYIVILLAEPVTRLITDTFTPKDGVAFNTIALKALFNQIINALIDLSSIVAVACIVLAGYAYFVEFFVNGGKQEGKIKGREFLSAGIIGLIVTTLAKPIVAFIQSIFGGSEGSLTLKTEPIIVIIKNVLANFLIPLGSLVSLVFIVASAYLWLTAGSDEEKVKNAKKFLQNALIGLVIVLLSTTIVQLIIYFIQPSISFIPGNTSGEIQKASPEIFK